MKFLLPISIFLMPTFSTAMTLNEFMEKVGVQNNYVQSQKLEAEAADLRQRDGDILTSPNFFTSATYTVDKKESQNPSFEGTQRNSTAGQVGLEQQSLLGLNHKLYYSLNNYELIGVDPTFFPNPNASNSAFTYEISVPVWRNGLGRGTKDQVAAVTEQSKSESLTAQFNQKQFKANAISVYWRLKSAQELYALSKELLEANNKFLKWTRDRVQDRLGETIDLRQAEAAVALREFELDQAQSELLEAQQAFNEMLEVSTETPIANLEALPNIANFPPQKKISDTLNREDIQSLESLLTAQNAQSRIAAENTKPQLDFTGMVSTNGLDPDSKEAFNKATTDKNPVYSIGLKLSIPLDRSSVGDIQKSAKLRSASIESQIARKKFEVKAELEKLERNYAQAMKVYSTAKAVEKAQLAKYQLETERRRYGRTTTFQLFSFQQEYQAAKQALIRAQSAILQLDAQFILFSK